MFSMMRALMGADGDLAKIVKVGDRVRHFNVKQWGRVLEVHPQPDGTAELVVEREVSDAYDRPGKGQWATYHIDQYEPMAEVAR